jgi:hypothetical protein
LIRFNNDMIPFAESDAQIAAHELGHDLLLPYARRSGYSLMNPSFDSVMSLKRLTQVDLLIYEKALNARVVWPLSRQ